MSFLNRALRLGEGKQFKSYEQRVARIAAFEEEISLYEDHEMREAADALRERARNGESLDDLLPECFALVREAGKRTMGMRHFDVQLIGGMVLHDGAIAEMKTGEGKTLTATLALVLNSLPGQGVHLITANDYLAKRDALWMKPIYDMLGVSIGILQNMQQAEEKLAAYAADITFGTNSEFGFDYLRDNMAKTLAEKVQHGGRPRTDGKQSYHRYAVVDEVDNILIDEARTPLIISGAPEQAADLYAQFARLAPRMELGKTPEGLDPRTKKEFVADFDFEVDEKYKTVSVTERGVAKAERFLGIDHLYRAENGHLVNHLIQALKAQALYQRGVDYEVIDGEVKIIDEHTGRIMEGRRWSEGLHQAVEAKEGVRVQEENQTLATITLQNYARMYDKLAGMTGTALTEATEFMKIYNLPVVQIPTNRPMIRVDRNDQVYKTKEGKWHAVVTEISARHQAGQPVLVGTISVEVSELLSERLKQRGIPHTVLNAKPEHAAREADVVAQAGRPGAVTIATNMAGRGVDIKLGGSAEHLAALQLAKEGLTPDQEGYEQRYRQELARAQAQVEADRERVVAAGGLYICGTERHESRRIDNQLRGRSGRQGDPGESRFFLSAEDDLIRLFAGDRIYKILDRLGSVDEEGHEEPIEAAMLSRQIEKAQKKVEEQNFLLRKRVLEYDDVINEQRRVIYAYRDAILEGKDMSEEARDQVREVLERTIEEYTASESVEEWDVGALLDALRQYIELDLDPRSIRVEELESEAFKERVLAAAMERYGSREAEIGAELMRALERYMLLEIIDERWREHLFDMDYLREGIHLRGVAQIDPLVAYKNEGYELFTDLMRTIWSDFARLIFHVQVSVEGPPGSAGPAPIPSFAAAGSATRPARVSYVGGSSAQGASAIAAAAAAAGAAAGGEYAFAGAEGLADPGEQAPTVQQRVLDAEHQLGRNDPCWCGSGKKYKRCHGA